VTNDRDVEINQFIELMSDFGSTIFDWITTQVTGAVPEFDCMSTDIDVVIEVITGAVISFPFVLLEHLLFIQGNAILQVFESLPNHVVQEILSQQMSSMADGCIENENVGDMEEAENNDQASPLRQSGSQFKRVIWSALLFMASFVICFVYRYIVLMSFRTSADRMLDALKREQVVYEAVIAMLHFLGVLHQMARNVYPFRPMGAEAVSATG
jgi:hypothetical protein